MATAQQLQAQIDALVAEKSAVFKAYRAAQAAAREKGRQLGVDEWAYSRGDPDVKALKTEHALLGLEIVDLQSEKRTVERGVGLAGGSTTQYTTYDADGDAVSVVTRGTSTGAVPVSQTAADPSIDTTDGDDLLFNSGSLNVSTTAGDDELFNSGSLNNTVIGDDELFNSGTVNSRTTVAGDDILFNSGGLTDQTTVGGDDLLFNSGPVNDGSNDYFYLDNAEDLDEIAAKYGVDPTSQQARDIWEQEYGYEDELNLNTGAATNSGATAPVARPPRSIHDGRKDPTLIGTQPIIDTDWRFRISLSPYADYLYKSFSPGILKPLVETDGVIFPYTPTIVRSSETNYQQYELTHSNFRGYFYSNSKEGNIMVTADFTAQDTAEAEYMLAMIHFFRSAGKMWYGQDARRGTPPPLLYLRGLGEHQFNEHACLLSTFTYTLPDNVDYIKTSNTATAQYAPKGRMAAGSGHESWSSKAARLITGGLQDFFSTGGLPTIPNVGVGSLTKITDGATYVPTKLQIQLALLPVNTRQQVSQEYSLEDFASGKLLKKGYW